MGAFVSSRRRERRLSGLKRKGPRVQPLQTRRAIAPGVFLGLIVPTNWVVFLEERKKPKQ